jgi:hypothetical protein
VRKRAGTKRPGRKETPFLCGVRTTKACSSCREERLDEIFVYDSSTG